MEIWNDYVAAISDALRNVAVTDRSGAALTSADGVARWVAMTRDVHERGGQLYFIGNGGSAGMASHMAADACKNGHLRAMAFNDPAMLTATSNDTAFDHAFSLPLQRIGRRGDQVIAITSSGNSPNVVRALDTCRTIGIEAITLTAMQPDNRARSLGDLNFYVALGRYGWAESAHQVILHYWFDQYLCEHRDGAL